MHTPNLSHTHTQIHPWHWIVMSDTKSTVLRCYISPHNTGVNWQYKPLNKACMLLTHTYTELSGLGFLSNCIHRAHTLSHSRIVRFVGWARCEDKMLNILAAGELHYWNVLRQHIQDDDGGGWRNTHMRSDCTAAVAHLNVPNRRPHSPISHAARAVTR